MKHILLSASLLLMAVSTYGQTNSPSSQPCTLKLSQAPAVRGVKLGMAVDELLSLFPGNSDNAGIKQALSAAEGYSHFGEATFYIHPSLGANKERYSGIAAYFLRSFDGRLVSIEVQYESFPAGARWKSADDLIPRFSDSFHLPGPGDWAPELGNLRKRLKCDGFEIVVTTDGDRGSIAFINRSWVQTQMERLAAFEDAKRREFEP